MEKHLSLRNKLKSLLRLVKGLEGELAGVVENENKMVSNPQENEQRYYDDYEDEKIFTGTVDKNHDHVAKTEEGHIQFRTNNELSQQISDIIEKNAGVWRCKICGKTASKNIHIRQHSEIHIEGMSFSCHICSKTFKNRPGLWRHISGIHSELFSCDICRKTGLNKEALRSHKRSKHN